MARINTVLLGEHVFDSKDSKTELEDDTERIVLVRVLDVVDDDL